jgi:hypothetical protein
MTQERFLTLDEAAIMLGGTERPFSRATVERMIQQGRLKDNGPPRAAVVGRNLDQRN